MPWLEATTHKASGSGRRSGRRGRWRYAWRVVTLALKVQLPRAGKLPRETLRVGQISSGACGASKGRSEQRPYGGSFCRKRCGRIALDGAWLPKAMRERVAGGCYATARCDGKLGAPASAFSGAVPRLRCGASTGRSEQRPYGGSLATGARTDGMGSHGWDLCAQKTSPSRRRRDGPGGVALV